jgi:hypothetical protein
MTEADRIARAWDAALDDMAERLQAGWNALAAGRIDIRPFTPPVGLGPLPIVLREKAERILEETHAFETALTHRSEAVARELVMAKRAPDAVAERPRYFDQAL